MVAHESKVSELQNELTDLNTQVKQKELEYRMNEMKIKEMRR